MIYHLSLIPKEQASNPREPAGDQLMLNHLRTRTHSDIEIPEFTSNLDGQQIVFMTNHVGFFSSFL